MTSRDEQGAGEYLTGKFKDDEQAVVAARACAAYCGFHVNSIDLTMMAAIRDALVPLVEADVLRRVRASIEDMEFTVAFWNPKLEAHGVLLRDVLAVVANSVRETPDA